MSTLDTLIGRGIHYSLDAMAEALKKRGHPEQRFPAIIIAGTNGKGSTAAMLHAMLAGVGYKTGLYTSPHLIDVTERIAIDEPIAANELDRWIELYEAEGILASLTYYEALTLAAFDYFAEREVDWAILEVGLGGRLDAVNLAKSEGAVITSIDFDHRDLLGDTIALIAREKAGVIHDSKPVVVGPLPADAMVVIEEVARERNASLYTGHFAWEISASGKGWIYDGQSALVVPELGLKGAHQGLNMGCALAAVERIVGIDPAGNPDAMRQALGSVTWPARFQVLRQDPPLVIDAAHNPAGSRALVDAWRRAFGDLKPTVVFASLREKDHNAMLAVLRQLSDTFWVSEVPDNDRSTARRAVANDPALNGATIEVLAPNALVDRMNAAAEPLLVTGSVAFAGWALTVFPRS